MNDGVCIEERDFWDHENEKYEETMLRLKVIAEATDNADSAFLAAVLAAVVAKLQTLQKKIEHEEMTS